MQRIVQVPCGILMLALFSGTAVAERISFSMKPSTNVVLAAYIPVAGFKRCVREARAVFDPRKCTAWMSIDLSAPQQIARGQYCIFARWHGDATARHRSFLRADVGTETQVRVYPIGVNQWNGAHC